MKNGFITTLLSISITTLFLLMGCEEGGLFSDTENNADDAGIVSGQASNIDIDGDNNFSAKSETPHGNVQTGTTTDWFQITGAKPYLLLDAASGTDWSLKVNQEDDSAFEIRSSLGGYKSVMHILPDGRVGIGTISPLGKLDVVNDGPALIRFRNSNSSVNWYIGQEDPESLNIKFASIYKRHMVIENTNTGSVQLDVHGGIQAEEIVVDSTWSDFVFEDDYKLRPLDEVEQFIDDNGHLPDVPSAKEVKEKGISLGKSQANLLQKIEELTLYVIEQNKEMKKQSETISELKAKVSKLRSK